MKKFNCWRLIAVGLSLLFFQKTAVGQITDKLRVLKNKATEAVRDATDEVPFLKKYYDNKEAPLSTSFGDAVFEIGLPVSFLDDTRQYQPLTSLPLTTDGAIMLGPGLFTGNFRSYCLKAGTYGPSQGNGHLYAPLDGPKAPVIRQILARSVEHPEVPQQHVQVLLWAIIARTKWEDMGEQNRQTARTLLTEKELKDLKTGFLDQLTAQQMEKAERKIAEETGPITQRVFQAENKIRTMVNVVEQPFELLERVAVLDGEPPEEDRIRTVQRGQWSIHPQGFFVRYMPNSYSRTRVDVFLPPAVEVDWDTKGRVTRIFGQNRGTFSLKYADAMRPSGSENGVSMAESTIAEASWLSSGESGKTSVLTDFTGKIIRHAAATETSETQEVEQTTTLATTEDGLAAWPMASESTSTRPTTTMATMQSRFSLGMTAARYGRMLNLIGVGLLTYDLYKSFAKADPCGEMLKTLTGEAVTSVILKGVGKQLDIPKNIVKTEELILWFMPDDVAVPAYTSGQRIGLSPFPIDPPRASDEWTKGLPKCPCELGMLDFNDPGSLRTYSPEGHWASCGAADQKHHFGATTEVRWLPEQKGRPGQQCTYDKTGKLITRGLAAGTPDRVSPQCCGSLASLDFADCTVVGICGHLREDVRTSETVPCDFYMKYWPPDHSQCLADNPVNDWHFGKMTEFMAGLPCPAIREMFLKYRDADNATLLVRQFMTDGYVVSPEAAADIRAFFQKKIGESIDGDDLEDHRHELTFNGRVQEYLKNITGERN